MNNRKMSLDYFLGKKKKGVGKVYRQLKLLMGSHGRDESDNSSGRDLLCVRC
jgi:hypothetical protein